MLSLSVLKQFSSEWCIHMIAEIRRVYQKRFSLYPELFSAIISSWYKIQSPNFCSLTHKLLFFTISQTDVDAPSRAAVVGRPSFKCFLLQMGEDTERCYVCLCYVTLFYVMLYVMLFTSVHTLLSWTSYTVPNGGMKIW